MATDNSPQPESQEVERRIMAFMQRELLSPEVIVRRDDDLLSGEILDSIGVMRLAAFVEEEFEINMQSADLLIENFQNVVVLAQYVLRATGHAGRPSANAGQ